MPQKKKEPLPYNNPDIDPTKIKKKRLRPKGRKFGLTNQIIENLRRSISAGVPVVHAATISGISPRTFYYYTQMAEDLIDNEIVPRSKKDKLLISFYQATTEAKSLAVQRNIGLINLAAQDDWKAAAWWLERTFPEEFGRIHSKEVVKEEVVSRLKEVQSTLDLSNLTDEELEKYNELCLKTLASEDIESDTEGEE